MRSWPTWCAARGSTASTASSSPAAEPTSSGSGGGCERSEGHGPLAYTRSTRAGVAQLVEQRSCKAWVVGSSPISGSRAGAARRSVLASDHRSLRDVHAVAATGRVGDPAVVDLGLEDGLAFAA